MVGEIVNKETNPQMSMDTVLLCFLHATIVENSFLRIDWNCRCTSVHLYSSRGACLLTGTCAKKRDNMVLFLTHLHVAHNNIFKLLIRSLARGTTFNFLVINTSNFLVNGRKLVYSLYRPTNDSEPTIVLSNLFIGTEVFKKWRSIYCFKTFLLRRFCFLPIYI